MYCGVKIQFLQFAILIIFLLLMLLRFPFEKVAVVLMDHTSGAQENSIQSEPHKWNTRE